MTLLVLGGIFCALVVIARELRLLRKQQGIARTSIEHQETSEKYKPRIFTFRRSRWRSQFTDLGETVGPLAVLVIWVKVILPLLPAEPWIRYPITVVGVIILGFLGIMVVEPTNGFIGVCSVPKNEST